MVHIKSVSFFFIGVALVTALPLKNLDDLSERELEDLSVRDPRFKLSNFAHKAHQIALGFRQNGGNLRNLLRPHRREEVDGSDDLVARDYADNVGREEADGVDDLISRDYDYELLD